MGSLNCHENYSLLQFQKKKKKAGLKYRDVDMKTGNCPEYTEMIEFKGPRGTGRALTVSATKGKPQIDSSSQNRSKAWSHLSP